MGTEWAKQQIKLSNWKLDKTYNWQTDPCENTTFKYISKKSAASGLKIESEDFFQYQYLWLKVVRPMVADTNVTAHGKVVLPHRRRVNTLDTPMEKN